VDSFSIAAIVFVVLGVTSLLKAFTSFQVRDKRFNKGVKKKFNGRALIYFGVSVVMFYLAFRFYYFA